ncbi:FAD-dependent oxidoreductase [Poseidonocella sp. HB161398]|uniref:FAD-dependent oxidoreductase n=1 Tax=Poseidonocella sp. HB161398 TaxID=2320855 RepID=UPI00110817BC|nr:FAD-dependent oxidoreductase [Poseidonocella sp. HB161398]
MTPVTRRRFLMQSGSAAAAALAAGAVSARRAAASVMIVGSGPAGIAAALALRAADPRTRVTLVERDPARLAPADSAAAAFRRPALSEDAASLSRQGVDLLLDDVAAIDWQAGRLELFSGRRAAFDRLILAPGVAPAPEAIDGLDARLRHDWPAAWGSAREARRLAAQIAAMPAGGNLVLRVPQVLAHDPALVAARAAALAAARPDIRLTVLDATPDAALRRAFAARASEETAARTAWRGAGAGGRVLWTDAAAGRIGTEAGEIRADVVNFLPRLGAGEIARRAGLADGGLWCPVDAAGRSSLRDAAFVIGDAAAGAVRGMAAAVDAGARAARSALS